MMKSNSGQKFLILKLHSITIMGVGREWQRGGLGPLDLNN